MKKTRSAKPRPTSKAQRSPKSVEEYLGRVPQNARSTFEKLRSAIRSAAPQDAEEIISYGIPALKQRKVLVWFAAFARHCSLFPTASVIAKFKNELQGFSMSKGTIQFPLDKPLPVPLIKELVKARVADANRSYQRD